MTSPGEIYAVVVAVLLLCGLAVSVPVLLRILSEGAERRRKRRNGELERYADDPEFDRGPPAALDEDAEGATTVSCPNCGAANERGFRYCRRCAESL